jgi:hypothetical protein
MRSVSFLGWWASRFPKSNIHCRKVWLLPIWGDGRGVIVSRMTARGGKSVSTGSTQGFGEGRLSVRWGMVVNGGNEFPSQYMEVLRTGTDDGARGEEPHPDWLE